MALYIAANAPLPEIGQTSPPAPLSVEPIEAADEAVRVKFSKPFVYFVAFSGEGELSELTERWFASVVTT